MYKRPTANSGDATTLASATWRPRPSVGRGGDDLWESHEEKHCIETAAAVGAARIQLAFYGADSPRLAGGPGLFPRGTTRVSPPPLNGPAMRRTMLHERPPR